jgi:hypothetical protein
MGQRILINASGPTIYRSACKAGLYWRARNGLVSELVRGVGSPSYARRGSGSRRRAQTLPTLPPAPLPHAKHGLLRQRMPELPRQHCDLTAVVSIVRDQIRGESGYIGAKTPDPSIILQCPDQDQAQRVPAALKRVQGLSRRHLGPVKLCGNFAPLGRHLQPHHPHVVHVGHDRGDGAPLAVLGLGFPGPRRNVVDQILVDAVVGIKSVEQRDREFGGKRLPPGHSIVHCGSFWHDFLRRGQPLGKAFNLA